MRPLEQSIRAETCSGELRFPVEMRPIKYCPPPDETRVLEMCVPGKLHTSVEMRIPAETRPPELCVPIEVRGVEYRIPTETRPVEEGCPEVAVGQIECVEIGLGEI